MGSPILSRQHRKFVLHSGGLDSSTALAVAADACVELNAQSEGGAENYDVVSVSLNYGQRHIREAEYAQKLCDHWSIEHRIESLSPPPKSMLTDPDSEVPDVSYADLPHGISPTYVPFRNGQMLSKIAGIAQGWVMEASGIRDAEIWFGAHAEDAANWAYPDCTPEFIGAMAAAIYVGTYHKVRLIAPFQHLKKGNIVSWGTNLEVPYAITWSCYKGEQLHCGTCPTCRSRKEAFEQADIPDPTIYQA